jgi:hypothetical protein
MRRGLVILVAAAATFATRGASALTITVADTTGLAPPVAFGIAESGLSFTSFGDPLMNSAGQVAYVGNLSGTGVNSNNNTGLYQSNAANGLVTPLLYLQQGQTVSGTLVRSFSGIAPAIGSQGVSTVAPAGNGTGVFEIFASSNGGNANLVAVASGSDGIGDTFNGGNPFSSLVANTAFSTGTSYASFTGATNNGSGVFQGVNGSLSVVARALQTMPNGTGYPNGSIWSSVSAGPIVPGTTATVFSGGATTGGNGLFIGISGAVQELVYSGTTAPGTGGSTFASFLTTGTVVNANQLVAFEANLANSTRGVFTVQGSLLGAGTGLAAIVRDGYASPDGNGTFSLAGTAAAVGGINAAGQVAFQTNFNGASNGSTSGIVVGTTGGSPTTTVYSRVGQLVPGGNGSFGSYPGAYYINSLGAVAFAANIQNATAGTGQGIYITGPGFTTGTLETVQVARLGQTLPAGTITALGFGNGSGFGSSSLQDAGGLSPFNDNGQVAYVASFGSRQQINVFTTDLHWRNNTGGGNFDTANNWTFGIAPVSVHDVFVDVPTGGYAYETVVGPSSLASVRGLTVGNVGGGVGNQTFQMNQGGGNLTVGADGLTVAANGTVELDSGTLTVASGAAMTHVTGTFNQFGGTFTNNNSAGLTVDASGSATLNGTSSFSTSLNNNGSVSVGASGNLSASWMNNQGTLSMNGGTITLLNFLNNASNGTVYGKGTIVGNQASSQAVVNNGSLTPGGTLTLSMGGAGGAFTNNGQVTIGQGSQLTLAGTTATLGNANQGTIVLSGGSLSASGGTNNFLLNYSIGSISGFGTISMPVSNDGGYIEASGGRLNIQLSNTGGSLGNVVGGQIVIDNGSSINTSTSFTNSGEIVLNGSTAQLVGTGAITNLSGGLVHGVGRVAASLTNGSGGVIRPEGGTLTLSGSAGNSSGGDVQIGTGSTLLLTSPGGFSNSGTVEVTGGTLQTTNGISNNAGGHVTIFGTLQATTGFTNNSTGPTTQKLGGITFTGGATSVYGPFVNTVGNGTSTYGVLIAAPTTFFGDVTNSGSGAIKISKTTATFNGNFSNFGAYISDPATSIFAGDVTGSGFLVGGPGDRFEVGGSLLERLDSNGGADLEFFGAGPHTLDVFGELTSNLGLYALDSLQLDAGATLALANDSGPGTGALFVHNLFLPNGETVAQFQASTTGDPVNIYYDPSTAGDAYLGGLTYALTGGGFLEPLSAPPAVPEPDSLALFGAAGLAVCLRARRRR